MRHHANTVPWAEAAWAKAAKALLATHTATQEAARRGHCGLAHWQGKGDSKFVLRVKKGSFSDSEIIVLLGQNGTGGTRIVLAGDWCRYTSNEPDNTAVMNEVVLSGKTTFIKMLAGALKADSEEQVPEMNV
jgi:translation initiation factor RLI1